MTNPTPHGQVPEALIDLIDAYAETRHRCGGIYNARTEAARKAVIEDLREALSGVQALSAAPAGFVPVAAFDRLHAHAESLAARLLAASPTPPAEQQAAPKAAPGVGNSGFDHQTAADFLSGKTVSDEAVRKFVAASRWAHDERAALSATLLAMHGVLTSREAEIARLKKALLEAEAAPQQEAQDPTEIPEEIERMAADRYKVVPSHESMFHRWAVVAGTGTQQLYLGREVECQNMARKFAGAFLDGAFAAMQRTAPQPAPAPLSDDAKDAARWRMVVLIGNEVMLHPDKRTHATAVKAYMDATHSGSDLTGAVDAAIAAQGGK